MAGEQKKVYLSTIAHIAGGAAVSSGGGFSAASDVDVAISNSNHSDYPYADLIMEANWQGTPVNGQLLGFYRRDMNISGANSEPVPTASRRAHFVGYAVITTGDPSFYYVEGVELTPECQFFVENLTAANLQNGQWNLSVRPWTYVPISA